DLPFGETPTARSGLRSAWCHLCDTTASASGLAPRLRNRRCPRSPARRFTLALNRRALHSCPCAPLSLSPSPAVALAAASYSISRPSPPSSPPTPPHGLPRHHSRVLPSPTPATSSRAATQKEPEEAEEDEDEQAAGAGKEDGDPRPWCQLGFPTP
ncbi:unnamed protein product, partial [Urochloa humidicola]